MRKFTDLQREHFKHLVLDCTVQRFTTQESLQYVKDKLGIEIGADHFNHVRAQLKQDVPTYKNRLDLHIESCNDLFTLLILHLPLLLCFV
jgi:transposase-like protein